MPDAPIPNTPASNTPKGSPTGPLPSVDGNTTVDASMQFEVEIAAYQSLRQAAIQIRNEISHLATPKDQAPKRIVYLDRPPAEYLAAYEGFQLQVQNLAASFESSARVAESALAALTAAPHASARPPAPVEGAVAEEAAKEESFAGGEILAAATSLLGLLRADVSFSGRKVTIDPLALPLELARAWQCDCPIQFIDPRFFPPEDLARSLESDVLTPLNDVSVSREKAFRSIHLLSQAVFQLAPDDPRLPGVRLAADSARDHFEAPDQILRALQTRLHAVDAASGTPLLEIIRMGAAIQMSKERPDTWFLFGRVIGSGGSFRTVRHLFRLLFFGDGAFFTGGVIVAYTLCCRAGGLMRSGVISDRRPYRSVFEAI